MADEKCSAVEIVTVQAEEEPSRTVRILQPNIVCFTITILAVCSITGMSVGATTFKSQSVQSTMIVASQASVLTSSICTIAYILVHVVAAYRNQAVGIIRPPVLKLHGACFIIARINFVLWMITLVLTCVTLSQRAGDTKDRQNLRVESVGVVMSCFSFVAMGVILTSLEACQYPFQPPAILEIEKEIIAPASPYGNDAMDGFRTLAINRRTPIQRLPSSRLTSLKTKPLPRAPSSIILEESERPLTPLLPMAEIPRQRGWGEEWRHLARPPTNRGLKKSDSAISGSSRSSWERKESRTITPGSSISNIKRRSPLSTVRSANSPDVFEQLELRYCPLAIPAPHEWNLSRTASLPELLPVARIQDLQRRSSVESKSFPVCQAPLPLSGHQRPQKRSRYLMKRRVPNPRSSNNCQISIDQERVAEEYVKTVETFSISRSLSAFDASSQEQKPDNGRERKTVPCWSSFYQKLGPQERYRESGSAPIARSHSATGSRELWALTSNPPDAEEQEIPKIAPLRRLSLGDISLSLGKIFT
ncbi:hypothetical protein GLAREA_06821 [Glarea lozoyensis ATCC 20868]|uniref:Uncharacterized protein n=1 Tax=Glarea lozoyensis (strain ATCC 20868 / MF5171) TaxID=1116229 RepID=S3E635_GLAL2|nr:uncharacterized protein GLAREA_06821 [Glarea lozoyensis ATCC 20868]EPE33808.1 hypothetical protein GLAREA_06821 [Glarea lozoyensis ATCC 20868]